jgi:hypothetical protein
VDLKGTGCEAANCILLAEDADQFRAVVNTVMKLQVLKKWGISLPAERLSLYR